MKIIERNLQSIGQSLLVSLPKEWTKVFKLKKGSKIKLITSEQGNLSIAPEFSQQEKKKESEIEFNETFQREFFREYFEGNDKITIHLKRISDKERKEMYKFFKRFMNVQIIEENREKIVLKSFKIEDLSIEECLKRMYFISLDMFEEKNKTALIEMRDTMTRFYYMLVMQIRRFLEEGKFTKENQISLVRAMDFRMAAEKIQRISEILLENINYQSSLKDYYSKSVLSFISEDYKKALSLWSEEKKLKKSVKDSNVSQILRFAKEISMLVR